MARDLSETTLDGPAVHPTHADLSAAVDKRIDGMRGKLMGKYMHAAFQHSGPGQPVLVPSVLILPDERTARVLAGASTKIVDRANRIAQRAERDGGPVYEPLRPLDPEMIYVTLTWGAELDQAGSGDSTKVSQAQVEAATASLEPIAARFGSVTISNLSLAPLATQLAFIPVGPAKSSGQVGPIDNAMDLTREVRNASPLLRDKGWPSDKGPDDRGALIKVNAVLPNGNFPADVIMQAVAELTSEGKLDELNGEFEFDRLALELMVHSYDIGLDRGDLATATTFELAGGRGTGHTAELSPGGAPSPGPSHDAI